MDPAEEEKGLHVAMELVFEDDPTPRREGDDDEGGEGELFAKTRRRGERCVWVLDR